MKQFICDLCGKAKATKELARVWPSMVRGTLSEFYACKPCAPAEKPIVEMDSLQKIDKLMNTMRILNHMEDITRIEAEEFLKKEVPYFNVDLSDRKFKDE